MAWFKIFKLLFLVTSFKLCSGVNVTKFIEENDDSRVVMDLMVDFLDFISKSHYGGYVGVIFGNDARGTVGDELLYYIQSTYLSKVTVLKIIDEDYENIRDQITAGHFHLGYLRLMLIITNDLQDLSKITNVLNNTTFHRPLSKTLILLNHPPEEKELQQTFKDFWKTKYANVVITYLENFHLKLFTFNPFMLDDSFLEDFSEEDVQKAFYNKFQNVYGRRFNVLIVKILDYSKVLIKLLPNNTYELHGQEINFLKCIVSKINGSIMFHPADRYVRVNERNPWRESNNLTFDMADTKRRIISTLDIDLINSEEVVEKDNAKGVTESLHPYFMDNLMIITPNAPKVPYYLCLFLIFRKECWYAFGVIFVIEVAVWYFISSNSLPQNKIIDFIRIMTGGGLPNIPTVNSERIYIMFHLFQTLILATAFTSNLTPSLMKDKYYKNYDTLRELDDAGVVLSGFGTQVKELKKAFNGSRYDLFNRVVTHPNKFDLINTTMQMDIELLFEFTKQHPIFLNNMRAMVGMRARVGQRRIHVVKETPLPNFTSFKVPLGSPYIDHLNKIYRKIIESGLSDYWKSMHDHFLVVTDFYFSPEELQNKTTITRSLTIEHFHAARLLIIGGWTISTLTFIAEMLYYKYSRGGRGRILGNVRK